MARLTFLFGVVLSITYFEPDGPFARKDTPRIYDRGWVPKLQVSKEIQRTFYTHETWNSTAYAGSGSSNRNNNNSSSSSSKTAHSRDAGAVWMGSCPAACACSVVAPLLLPEDTELPLCSWEEADDRWEAVEPWRNCLDAATVVEEPALKADPTCGGGADAVAVIALKPPAVVAAER